MAQLLSDEEIGSRLHGVDWKLEGHRIVHGRHKVRFSLTNHSAGGLTDVDFEMAGKFDGMK
jgi:Pterin 4 alpha carbinolamine dehydratase